MSNEIIALVLFIAALGGLALFYGKLGKLSFWKLASKFPEKALEYISNDPAWVVLQGAEPAPGPGFTGPFRLAVPSLGQTLKLYVREDQIEASQQRFIEMHQEFLPRHGFPYLSLLALLYPALANSVHGEDSRSSHPHSRLRVCEPRIPPGGSNYNSGALSYPRVGRPNPHVDYGGCLLGDRLCAIEFKLGFPMRHARKHAPAMNSAIPMAEPTNHAHQNWSFVPWKT